MIIHIMYGIMIMHVRSLDTSCHHPFLRKDFHRCRVCCACYHHHSPFFHFDTIQVWKMIHHFLFYKQIKFASNRNLCHSFTKLLTDLKSQDEMNESIQKIYQKKNDILIMQEFVTKDYKLLDDDWLRYIFVERTAMSVVCVLLQKNVFATT